MNNMIGLLVYIKFGVHHGKKGQIVGISEKDGVPSFLLRLQDGEIIEKKQKNCVRMLPNNA
jgi:hypothetical protein